QVRAGLDEDRQGEPPPLPARQPRHRLLRLGAGEEEAAEQRARLAGRQSRGALRRLQDASLRSELLGVLRQVAELDVVTRPQLALLQGPPPRQRLDQRGLAHAVRPDEGHVLASLEPQVGAGEQLLVARRKRRALQLQDNTARTRRLVEAEAERTPVARVALDPLHLLEPLGARLRLPRARAGAEAGHEPLQPLDLRLLALDRAAEGQLARGLLLAPGVPGPGEEARAPALQLEHGRADSLEEPAVVGDED